MEYILITIGLMVGSFFCGAYAMKRFVEKGKFAYYNDLLDGRILKAKEIRDDIVALKSIKANKMDDALKAIRDKMKELT